MQTRRRVAKGERPGGSPFAYGAITIVVATALATSLSHCASRKPEVPPIAAPAPPPAPEPTPSRVSFEATAYSITGTTASGTQTRRGIVAADPALLPLGSRIRVHGARGYSGVYTVADTGRTIDGREIDIYMPDAREAKRFGRRRVEVEVLEYGKK